MNIHSLTSQFRLFSFLFGVFFLAAPLLARAQTDPKYYFWVTRPPGSQQDKGQSFVIEVDSAAKAEIDALRASGRFAGFAGRIAVGSVDYNRDYFAPGQPVWNWHVAFIDNIFDYNDRIFPDVVDPNHDANPSDIAINPGQWIADNGPHYVPRNYLINREVDPSRKDAMVNVSNRGFTGAGEKTLIAGFIITGGEPRNVVVRALGPSLSASGVQQVVANPKIEVFSSSGQRIESNADWKSYHRADQLRASYPSLAPSNDREAAMLLTLLPGAYTLQGISEDASEGVMILEVYDVDSETL